MSHLILSQLGFLHHYDEIQTCYVILLKRDKPLRTDLCMIVRTVFPIAHQECEMIQRCNQIERNIYLFPQFIFEDYFVLILFYAIAERNPVIQMDVFIIFRNHCYDKLTIFEALCSNDELSVLIRVIYKRMKIITTPFITKFIRSSTFILSRSIKDDIGTVHCYLEDFIVLNLFFKVNCLSFLDLSLCALCQRNVLDSIFGIRRTTEMKVCMNISLCRKLKLAACFSRTTLLTQLNISFVASQEIDFIIIFALFISKHFIRYLLPFL